MLILVRDMGSGTLIEMFVSKGEIDKAKEHHDSSDVFLESVIAATPIFCDMTKWSDLSLMHYQVLAGATIKSFLEAEEDSIFLTRFNHIMTMMGARISQLNQGAIVDKIVINRDDGDNITVSTDLTLKTHPMSEPKETNNIVRLNRK